MYTDLNIVQETPKHLFSGLTPSTVYTRYLIAMIYNTKVITKTICNFRRIVSANNYHGQMNEFLFKRADLFSRECQRAKLRTA